MAEEQDSSASETPEVAAELLEGFNQAASLAFEGQAEPALEAWSRLLEQTGEDTPAAFVGEALMRRAWVLMDLERYEEAAEALALEAMEPYLDSFSDEVLFEYFFCNANTLGSLGRITEMDGQFRRAMYIAANQLGDVERCQRCWVNMALLTEQAGDWVHLEKVGESGQKFAQQSQLPVMGFIIGMHHVTALKNLGRLGEARAAADLLVEQADEFNDEEAAARARALRDALV